MLKFPASAAVLLLIALGATACKKADAPADSGDGASPAPAAAAPAAAAPTAAAPAAAATPDGGDAETKYQCSTQVVPVSYKPGSVTLKLKDKVLELKADTANSSRYIGTDVEWWINGRGPGATANLYSRTPEGEAADVLEGCTENPKA